MPSPTGTGGGTSHFPGRGAPTYFIEFPGGRGPRPQKKLSRSSRPSPGAGTVWVLVPESAPDRGSQETDTTKRLKGVSIRSMAFTHAMLQKHTAVCRLAYQPFVLKKMRDGEKMLQSRRAPRGHADGLAWQGDHLEPCRIWLFATTPKPVRLVRQPPTWRIRGT